MPSRPLTNFSLFSGAGGLDIGLGRAGFQTRVCVENDKHCKLTLEANQGKLSDAEFQILGDITELEPFDLLEMGGLKQGEVDLVSGGPPCQAFSTAGHRQSINDPRGQLFTQFARMVEGVLPRFFVVENVKGLTSAAIRHRPLDQRTDDHPPLTEQEELGSFLKLKVLPRFGAMGYQVIYGTLNALDYGAAQDRERFFIIGSRDSEIRTGNQLRLFSKNNDLPSIKKFIPATHNRKAANGPTKPTTLGVVIRDIEDCPGDYIPYSPERERLYRAIPEGCNWRYLRDSGLPDGTVKEYLGGAYSSTGGRVGFWRRLDYAKWAPTLTTSPVQKATGLCHPKRDRPLSINEYKRIQGFPDDWELAGSLASQYRQLGNAVPTQLGEAVGRAISDIIYKLDG